MLWLLWLPGAVVATWSVLTRPAAGMFVLATLTAAALSALALARFWCTAPVGWLRWDGQRWTLEPQDGSRDSGEPVQIEIGLDLQRLMLLRACGGPAHRAEWLWLERRRSPESWHLLRCALFGGGAAKSGA